MNRIAGPYAELRPEQKLTRALQPALVVGKLHFAPIEFARDAVPGDDAYPRDEFPDVAPAKVCVAVDGASDRPRCARP